MLLLLSILACAPDKDNPPDTGSDDTGTTTDTADTADTTDTSDSGVVEEVDPAEEGREGQVICSSGGSVSSSNFSGSFCFGAVDLSSSPTATSANYTWHAGPMTKVSP